MICPDCYGRGTVVFREGETVYVNWLYRACWLCNGSGFSYCCDHAGEVCNDEHSRPDRTPLAGGLAEH